MSMYFFETLLIQFAINQEITENNLQNDIKIFW